MSKSQCPRLAPEVRAGIEAETAAFRRRFGRMPCNDDPVIFDRDAPTPQPLTGNALLVHLHELGTRSGMKAPTIYAHHKLFRQLGEGFDAHLWEQAIHEYYFYAHTTDVAVVV